MRNLIRVIFGDWLLVIKVLVAPVRRGGELQTISPRNTESLKLELQEGRSPSRSLGTS
ncbi:hypothetical protein [Gracilimonas sp.]|uniref:hypothetical protein n=1 Tax=Gracilimonas sp. TaxID=1974203 RepID=UPI002871DCCF|nr:hypothetical protein [Gracilimonas sp.]